METKDLECCPEFNVEKWDHKTVVWENKKFIREKIPTFFHIPFYPMIGKKMMKLHTAALKSEATIPDKLDALVLFRDPTPFRSELYYAVTDEVEGIENLTLSGIYAARVFDGPYNSVPRHVKEMEKELHEKGKKAKDYYIHYAYCPKCAKKFGHNYMILFAQLDN